MVIYGHMKAKSLLSTKNITPPPKKNTDKQTNKNEIRKQRKKKTPPLRNVPP